MPTLIAAAVVLTATAAAAVYAHRARQAARALAREQAVARLAGAVHYRDMQALKARLSTDRRRRAVLAEADRILTAALAQNPKEGGSR